MGLIEIFNIKVSVAVDAIGCILTFLANLIKAVSFTLHPLTPNKVSIENLPTILRGI